MARPARILSAGSLGRAAAEIGIIVAGVLIALAADSWREARVEAGMAAEYRAALLDDLVADSALYAVFIESGWLDVQAAAVDSIEQFLAEPGRKADPITLVQWLANSLRLGIGEKTSATFDDMRSSGRLSYLDDAELRRGLIDYYGVPIIRDDRPYQVLVTHSLERGIPMLARLLGPRRNRDARLCGAWEGAVDTPLDSPEVRSCLVETGSFQGFDLGARMREDPEVAASASIMRLMRELGLRGATSAREEAAELRARLAAR